MALTSKDIQSTIRIKRCVTEFFEANDRSRIQAKDLMPLFIEKGIFEANVKDGLPIRNFLRHLEKENHLHLIPQAFFEPKDVTKNWYFLNPKRFQDWSR